jgi:protein-S-isoprenylcysteine O-methyltransferase Ste14
MFETKRADWYFIIPATLIWILALLVTAWDFLQIQQGVYRFHFVSLVGLVSVLMGIVTRRWARKELGQHFSSRLRLLKNHRLAKDGIYKHVRHPAYLGNFLFWLGTPLLFSSRYGFLVMLLLVPCFLYRINVEERMLVERFGDEYLKYVKHSKRLIPFLY